jgi:hypothetical protein
MGNPIIISYKPPTQIASCLVNNLEVIAKKKDWSRNKVITKALHFYFKSQKEKGMCVID